MKTIDRIRSHTLGLFEKHHIPFHEWSLEGKGSLANLLEWIRTGEAQLEERQNGLILHIHVSIVPVRYRLNGTWYELFEDRHGLVDGTVKRRHFDGHLGEKIHRAENETPCHAARRGLKEELGFLYRSPYTIVRGRYEVSRLVTGVSDYYPGLTDVYHRHYFTCFIGEKIFSPSGYTEVKGGHTIFFIWREGWS